MIIQYGNRRVTLPEPLCLAHMRAVMFAITRVDLWPTMYSPTYRSWVLSIERDREPHLHCPMTWLDA